MKTRARIVFLLVAAVFAASACSRDQRAARDMQENVEKSLEQAGIRDVTVSLDHEKRLVTLDGKVQSQEQKDRAAQIAQSAAAGHAVANQIAVEPPGAESEAREITENVDAAIEKSFQALLIANKLDNAGIRFESKNGALTLEGKVESTQVRTTAEKLAATVPHVEQVVNKLEVNR